VRLSNVLEHLPDPLTAFEEIDRILKPDGLVYVTVPNTRSLVFWLFRENWYALDAPRHVIFYCPSTLETLCDATGFEIARMRFTAGPFNFVRSLILFFAEDGKRWPVWIRRIRWERSKFVRRALKPFSFLSMPRATVISCTRRCEKNQVWSSMRKEYSTSAKTPDV
jgi:SAM-dependent methyltransferase